MNAHNAALGGTPQRLKRGIPLALRGVARRFGEREVLKDIDLLVPAGQFVAIVGRSGCGKSTLLRLLAGLDQPSRGELLAGSAALAEAREDTRLMFQDSRLLPWKRVIDNVGLGLRGDWRAKALQALRRPRPTLSRRDWPRWKPKCSTGCWRSRSCRRNPNPFHPCPRNCAGRSNQPCLVPSPPRRNAMTIKAINVRNQFKGTVKEIIEGPVLSEIDVQTAAGIVTSVITTRSVKELELAIGSEVIAFVKSTEVSIAKL